MKNVIRNLTSFGVLAELLLTRVDGGGPILPKHEPARGKQSIPNYGTFNLEPNPATPASGVHLRYPKGSNGDGQRIPSDNQPLLTDVGSNEFMTPYGQRPRPDTGKLDANHMDKSYFSW
jgi:hypothetical protein